MMSHHLHIVPYAHAPPQVAIANQISVVELRKNIDARTQRRKAAYTHVIERCYIRIKRCGMVGRMHCVYDVPSMITGMPLYDLQECMNKLMENLKMNGYCVWIDPFEMTRLNICWSDACLEAEKQAQQPRPKQTTPMSKAPVMPKRQKHPQRLRTNIGNFKLF